MRKNLFFIFLITFLLSCGGPKLDEQAIKEKQLGINSDVNLNAFSHAEFDGWKWADKKTAITSVVRFKKAVYESIFDEFADVLKGLKDN